MSTDTQWLQAVTKRIEALEINDKKQNAVINKIFKAVFKHNDNESVFSLANELNKRGLTKDPDVIQRIDEIVKQYPKLKPDQICGLLDKAARMNEKDPIRNLAGYLNNAFRKDFTFYHKDYDGMDV